MLKNLILIWGFMLLANMTAQENLWKNFELKMSTAANPESTAKFAPVMTSMEFFPDKDFRGRNAITTVIKQPEAGKSVMVQVSEHIRLTEGGKYILSMYFKSDHPISWIRLVSWNEKSSGKKFQAEYIRADNLPEPGQWKKIMAEFNLTEGLTMLGARIYDDKDGTNIWISAPSLIKKLEE